MKEVVFGRHEGVALNNSETMLTKTFKVDGLVKWDLIFFAKGESGGFEAKWFA